MLLIYCGLILFVISSTVYCGGNLNQLHVSSKSVHSFLQEFSQRYIGSSVPGMVVSVVKDGKTLYSGGFGRASDTLSEKGKLMKMDGNTLIKVGSTAKLLSTVAIMQLLEEGKIQSLSDPIDMYVPGIIANITANSMVKNKITIHHLLTHTTGLEDKRIGLLTPWSKKVNSTAFLEFFPKRVHTPGVAMTYSHHAYALLSPLIQNLNEQSFEEYMQEKVLTPLDMHHSTFQTHDLNDPVMKMYMQKEHDEKSSNTYKNVASGFVKKASGSFKSVGDLYVNAIPAAGLATTATDMAKFLKMILGEGKHKKRILSSKSVKLMLSRQFSVHDAVDGSGYGWVERHFTNNVRVLLHGGDLPGFSSLAFMIPNEKIGCFIAMNANDQHLRSTFLSEFVNKFSDSKSNSDTESIYRQELSSSFSFEGNYRPMRSAYTSFESIQSILGQVKITKQGSNLFLSASPSGFGYFYEFNYELIPQSQDVFKVSTGKPHPQDEIKVAFIRGNDAHPPMLVTNALSDMPLTFQSISFFSSYTFLLASWCVCMVTFTVYLLSWILLGLFRKMETIEINPKYRSLSRINLAISTSSRLEILVASLSASYLLFYGLLFFAIWKFGYDEIMAGTQLPSSIRTLFYMPFVSQILNVSLFTYLLQEGNKHSVSRIAEASVVCIASVLMMYLQYEFNLWIYLA